MNYEASRRDAEKRWSDPPTFRAAAKYVIAVVALTAVAFAATVAWHSLLAGILVPAILFAGAMGAWIRTVPGGLWWCCFCSR